MELQSGFKGPLPKLGEPNLFPVKTGSRTPFYVCAQRKISIWYNSQKHYFVKPNFTLTKLNSRKASLPKLGDPMKVREGRVSSGG